MINQSIASATKRLIIVTCRPFSNDSESSSLRVGKKKVNSGAQAKPSIPPNVLWNKSLTSNNR